MLVRHSERSLRSEESLFRFRDLTNSRGTGTPACALRTTDYQLLTTD
jgi:hypothetical protein